MTLRPGGITGLVGPNGAGRTTLPLMRAGLVAPDSGSIELDDVEVQSAQLRTAIG
ncbi:MAG: ATP-binding cassette domain-containing protein [Micrococcales bacterium]|nr:ATP-binding cassette domain-containing protein [Micrococcales bacterium]